MKGEILKSHVASVAATVDWDAPYADVIVQPYHLKDLADLLLLSGYHARCIFLKAACIAFAGYECDTDIESLCNEPFEELLFRFLVDYEATGNAYFEVARLQKKAIALWHVESPFVWIKPDRSFVQEVLGMQDRVEFAAFGHGNGDVHELAHMRQYTPISSYYGLPAWIGSLLEVQMEAALKKFNAAFFNNHALPEYAVIAKQKGETELDIPDLLKQFFQEQYSGIDRAHRTLFLELDQDAEIKFEKITADLKDMDFKNLYEKVRDAIISAHGVPPRLLGVISAGQLGGGGEVEGQLKVFQETYLEPLRKKTEAFISKIIQADFRLKKIDITTAGTDTKNYSQLVQAGILTPEEARAALEIQKSRESIA